VTASLISRPAQLHDLTRKRFDLLFYKAKQIKEAQGKLKRLSVCVPLWDLLMEGLETNPTSRHSFHMVLSASVPNSFNVTTSLDIGGVSAGGVANGSVVSQLHRTPQGILMSPVRFDPIVIFFSCQQDLSSTIQKSLQKPVSAKMQNFPIGNLT
jgi:hypothetical protein